MSPEQGPRLAITDNPSAGDRAFLDERIYEYNVAATGIPDGRLLGITIRDERGNVTGGLYGWTWGGCLWIEYLWVREEYRGKGYGTRLLATAEDEARARGCRQAALDTHSFQAPSFYHRLGYEIVGEIDDYPSGFKQFMLRKSL